MESPLSDARPGGRGDGDTGCRRGGIGPTDMTGLLRKLSETPYLAALSALLMAVTVGAGLTLVLSGARVV